MRRLGDDLTWIKRIGLEAGPLSEWLVRELSVLGFVVTLLETRQVRAALSAMITIGFLGGQSPWAMRDWVRYRGSWYTGVALGR